MDPTNTGSFGSATGGMSPELQAAISRRAGGNPSGTTGQVTQGSPTFDPTIQQPQSSPMSAPASVGVQMPQGMGGEAKLPTPETELIVRALAQRLSQFPPYKPQTPSKIQGG